MSGGVFLHDMRQETDCLLLCFFTLKLPAESYDPVMVTLLELMRKAHNEWSDLISERYASLSLNFHLSSLLDG